MIGHCAGHPAHSVELVYMGQAGLIQQHALRSLEGLGFINMNLQAKAAQQARWRKKRRAHAADFVVGDEVMRVHRRGTAQAQAAVRSHAALDHGFGTRHIVRSQQHAGTHFQIAVRPHADGVEVKRGA